MDRHTKKDSYDGVLSKEEFEAIMNEESLSCLPALVNNMNENLSIHICEFIENPLLIFLKLNQGKLIDVIKTSNKFHYDTKTLMIKFKKKPGRNILMVINFMKNDEFIQVKDKKENFIKQLISECNSTYVQYKLKKIHRVGDSIHFVFEHEDISMEIEKFLLDIKNPENNFIPCNSTINMELLQEFKNAQTTVCLGAESLKRRVSSRFSPQFESLSAQSHLIQELLMNPVVQITNKKKQSSRPGSFKDSHHFSNIISINSNSANKPAVGQMTTQRHWSGINKFDLMATTSTLQMQKQKEGGTYAIEKMSSIPRRIHGSDSTIANFGAKKLSLSFPFSQYAAYTYDFKEIMSVYNHMKFLKIFELPDEFKDQKFVKEIMVSQARSRLDYSLDVPLRVNPRMSNDFVSYRYYDFSGSRNRKSFAGLAIMNKYKKQFSIDKKIQKRDRSLTQNKSTKFK